MSRKKILALKVNFPNLPTKTQVSLLLVRIDDLQMNSSQTKEERSEVCLDLSPRPCGQLGEYDVELTSSILNSKVNDDIQNKLVNAGRTIRIHTVFVDKEINPNHGKSLVEGYTGQNTKAETVL